MKNTVHHEMFSIFARIICLVMIVFGLQACSSDRGHDDTLSLKNSISAGWYISTVITKDGHLYSWGGPRKPEKGTVEPIGTDNDWDSVASSINYSVIIKKNGTLYYLDYDDIGEDGSLTPKRIGTESDWVFVTNDGSGGSPLALRKDGSLYSLWYSGVYVYPTKIETEKGWARVAGTDGGHYLGIKTDGSLYAWGNNDRGQLGDGTYENRTHPVRVGSDNDWASVEIGDNYSFGLKKDGTLYAWGSNGFGQLGDGTYEGKNTPTRISPKGFWKKIETRWGYTLALKKDGSLYEWGLDNPTFFGSDIPVPIESGNDWDDIDAGFWYNLAVKKDGKLYAWGHNGFSRIGVTVDKKSPVRVGSDSDWAVASAGCYHSLGLKTDGSLYSWGNNRFIPTQIGEQTNWASISAGWQQNLALTSEGFLYAWGYFGDDFGYDDNPNNYIPYPVRIGNETDWKSISAGKNFNLAVTSEGLLFVVSHTHEQGEPLSPMQLGTYNFCEYAFAGSDNGLSINVDGSLYSHTSYPYDAIRIGTDTDWISASIHSSHSLAIKSDGSLYAWGNNDYGQLGDGTKTAKENPTRIGTDTDWAYVAAGDKHSLALKTDGSLYGWGSNVWGQVGDDTFENKVTPTRIGSDTDWQSISAGYDHSLALKQNGSLYAWGMNSYGELGVGSIIVDSPLFIMSGF